MMMLIVVCFLHAVAKDNENVNYLRLLRYARNDGLYFRHCEEVRRGNLLLRKRLLHFIRNDGLYFRHCEEVRRGNLLLRKRLLHFIRNDVFYFVIARRYDGAICYLERDCFISFAMTEWLEEFASLRSQ